MVMNKQLKKICFVNPGFYKYTIGGTEVQLYLIAQELLNHNFEVHYLTNDVEQFEVIDGINLHPFRECQKNYEINYKRFVKIIEKIQPDIFYQRGRKSSTYYVGRYAYTNKIPFVFAASMDIDCKLLKKIPRLFQEKNIFRGFLNIPFTIYHDIKTLRSIKKANICLSQSKQQQLLFKQKLKLNSIVVKNYHPIPNYKHIYKDKPPVVLWLANIKGWKQPELFIEISRRLQNQNAKYILAGRMADEKYRNRIESWANERQNFEYIENVDLNKSNDLMKHASIFVNTSLKNEGFPNTFIQAWAHKTPTITLYFDPDDIIKKNKMGYHSKNICQLTNDVSFLIENDKLCNEMGNTAYEYVKSEYSRTASIDKLIRILSNLLN